MKNHICMVPVFLVCLFNESDIPPYIVQHCPCWFWALLLGSFVWYNLKITKSWGTPGNPFQEIESKGIEFSYVVYMYFKFVPIMFYIANFTTLTNYYINEWFCTRYESEGEINRKEKKERSQCPKKWDKSPYTELLLEEAFVVGGQECIQILEWDASWTWLRQSVIVHLRLGTCS